MLWCVFGGLLVHFFECNILDILLKTKYEKPVDSAQDVLDRGSAVINPPGTESRVQILKNSPSAVTRALAKKTVVPKVIFNILKNFHFDTKII